MPDVKQLQIGENVYDIHDVTARTSLAGKQNTISDLSTIRTNASNAKSKSDTAIIRLNAFSIEVCLFYLMQEYTIPASSANGYLGAQSSAIYDGRDYYNQLLNNTQSLNANYGINTTFSWLGTLGWHGSNKLIATRMSHSSVANAQTTVYLRNLTTSAVTLSTNDSWTREVYLVLG